MAILQKLKSWLPQTDIAPDPLNAETVPNSKRLNRLPLLIFGAAWLAGARRLHLCRLSAISSP